MIDAMQKELEERKDVLNEPEINSIYFGGGTPSLLLNEELEQLLNAVYKHFSVGTDPEITLEANPDDISFEKILSWKSLGINRLSIGVQSFNDVDLHWMNRAHTAQESLNCIHLARKGGFENISIDLIYGLPGLDKKEWSTTIYKVLDLEIPHISAYCLTIEQKTQLSQLVNKGLFIPSSEDQQSEHFIQLAESLEKAGFHHYEISNFSRPGREAVHNSNYWKGKEYLGIGPSAHSFYGATRSWNVANNSQYMLHVEQHTSYFQMEILTKSDRWNELLLTGLRTSEGVNLSQLYQLEQPSESFNRNLAEFQKNEWLSADNERIWLTREGKLRADFIASELFL